jgi:CO/xanthine dehydrogenase Mo-binding subunit
MRIVGTNVPRKEGPAKLTGAAKYVDDLTPANLWHGATVRSTIPRGRIVSIAFPPSIAWDEFVIATAGDIPGRNMVPMFLEDQPLLAKERVNHPEEPILLLAHENRERLAEAVAAVQIAYAEEPAVFTIEESLRCDPVIWSGSANGGYDNTFKKFHLEHGDVDAAFAAADFIVEETYETGAQEQLYIETNGMIAEANPEQVTVWGSLQCPFYVHRALKTIFALDDDHIRVIQTETGGAFGGKEEYPSVLAGHAALLSLKCGRPVKMIYDRAEDMAATTKRHPSRTRHRTAVSREGKLLACDIDLVIDGGAYSTLSATVCSRATIHAAGPYQWPAVRVRSCAVATNTPPSGAFRGFGAPQSLFAIERHMDKIARVVGLTPEELRRRNFIQHLGTTATGQIVQQPLDLSALLDHALEVSNYHGKTALFARENPHSPIKRGIGFATFMHGSGFTGSGERYLNSLVGVEGTREGKVRVLVSSTEFGQGTNTILAQVAAEALNAHYAAVEIAQPDTGVVPNSGPTVASRTVMVVGKLVERAARALIATLRESGFLGPDHTPDELSPAVAAYVAQFGTLQAFERYAPPGTIYWDDQKYMGDAYPAYAWAVYVAEVAVDMTTYTPTVTEFHALQEVGKVLHPILAAGQIEGGVAQGIGFALYEKCVWSNGRMINNQMTNYIMPTSADLPPIHVHFEEIPFEHGAFGAKGIGELPMDGPAPAILNAIENATGMAFTHVPLMPEDVFAKAMFELTADDLAITRQVPSFPPLYPVSQEPTKIGASAPGA